MNRLEINVIFPEYENRDYTDFALYGKYYELFTCMYMIQYLENNVDVFKESDVLDSLRNEFNKRLATLEFRSFLGNFANNKPMDNNLIFEEYELVNKMKEFITCATEYDEVTLTYTKKDAEYFHKEFFEKFVSNEPVVEENSMKR